MSNKAFNAANPKFEFWKMNKYDNNYYTQSEDFMPGEAAEDQPEIIYMQYVRGACLRTQRSQFITKLMCIECVKLALKLKHTPKDVYEIMARNIEKKGPKAERQMKKWWKYFLEEYYLWK